MNWTDFKLELEGAISREKPKKEKTKNNNNYQYHYIKNKTNMHKIII